MTGSAWKAPCFLLQLDKLVDLYIYLWIFWVRVGNTILCPLPPSLHSSVSQFYKAAGRKLILKKGDDFSRGWVESAYKMVLRIPDTTYRKEKQHVAIFLYTLFMHQPVQTCCSVKIHARIGNICVQFHLSGNWLKIGTLVKIIWNQRLLP